MIRLASSIIPMLALLAGCGAQSQSLIHLEPVATGSRLLAAGCVSCHGSDEQPPAGGLPLAGLKEPYFIAQMQAFQSGQRTATLMHQIAKGYDAAQVASLARYFALQRRPGERP